jgi:DNA/RNA endonuclease YhcR with UshA esterase domain
VEEARGLLGKKITFDGKMVEVFVRGDSKARYVASEIEKIEQRDKKGRLDVVIFSGGRRELLAFDAMQRPQAEQVLGAIEAHRTAL